MVTKVIKDSKKIYIKRMVTKVIKDSKKIIHIESPLSSVMTSE
jgi:hypothetical protein